IRDLLLEAEAEGERVAVSPLLPRRGGEDDVVLRVRVLRNERLDERALSDHAVGVRSSGREAADEHPDGACTYPHARSFRRASREWSLCFVSSASHTWRLSDDRRSRWAGRR